MDRKVLSGGLFSGVVKPANAEQVAVANLINDFLNLFQDILLLQRSDLINAASKKTLYLKKFNQQSWFSATAQQFLDYLSICFFSAEEILQSLYKDVSCSVSDVASLQKEPAVHDLVITEFAIALIENCKDYLQSKASLSVHAHMLEFLLGVLDKFPVMKHSSPTIYDHLSPHIAMLGEMLKSINTDLPIKMKDAKMLWNTGPVQQSLRFA